MITTYKEFEEKIKELGEFTGDFYCICSECDKEFRIIKPQSIDGKNIPGTSSYYRIVKTKEIKCNSCAAGKKPSDKKPKSIINPYSVTYNKLSEEERKRIVEAQVEGRRKSFEKKRLAQLEIVYNSYDDLKEAYSNKVHAASFICQDCGKKIELKNANSINHYLKAHKDKKDLRCRGCSITHTKIQNNFEVIINNPNKMRDCYFKEGQEYVGAELEKHRDERKMYTFVCEKCGREFQDNFTVDNLSPVQCPDCHKKEVGIQVSSQEREIEEYIKTFYDGEVRVNDRVTIFPKELDICLPDKKIAFEIDGVYWHSDAWRDENFHIDKTLSCENRGIQLIHIFEDEWKYNRDKVENLIDVLLGNYKKIEDHQIIDITNDTARIFTDQYSLESFEEGDLNRAIINNNDILMLLTIKDNTVINIVNRKGFYSEEIIKEVLDDIPFIKIKIDRRFYTSKSFEGFSEEKTLEPKFWYVKSDYRVTDKPENYKNIHKIYNCGYSILTRYPLNCVDSFEYFKTWDFPYQEYEDKELKNEWENLKKRKSSQKYSSSFNSKLIRYFHRSLYSCNKEGKKSPTEYWDYLKTNFNAYSRIYNNRIKYAETSIANKFREDGLMRPETLRDGFSILHIAPCVSYFKPTLAKDLIEDFLGDCNTIFDPFSGYSGRMLGTLAAGKNYIGIDINETTINESRNLLNYLGLNADIRNDNIFNIGGSYDALFTCPPYENIEIWGDKDLFPKTCDEWIDECLKRFNCKKYLFVINNTEKYKDKIVGEIENKRFSGSTREYIILI